MPRRSERDRLSMIPMLALALALLVGCSAAPQAKTASGEVVAAIEGLGEAQDEIRMLLIERIEETRWQIVDAVIAKHVADQVSELASREPEADLIRVAETLRRSRRDARKNLARVMAIEAAADDEPAVLVADLEDEISEDLRALARFLEPGEEVDVLHRQADTKSSPGHQLIEAHRADLENIVRLAGVRAMVENGFEDLGLYLQFLSSLQRQLNRWLTTETEVGGEDLARWLDENARFFEPRSTAGGPAS